MLQSPERKTPVPTDTMAKLRQAASTFPQTPSIIRHIPLTDPELSEVYQTMKRDFLLPVIIKQQYAT